MKKYLALALAAMMLLTLAACGSEPAAPTSAPTAAPVATEAPATEAPTEEPTEATEEVVTAMDMEKTVLVDDENCAFTVGLASENAHVGMTLEAECVNKTDSPMIFAWNTVSVCGLLYDPLWAQEVTPGETVGSTIYIDTWQLEQYGVTSVDEIEFTLHIFDSEDFMAEPYVNTACTIYPTGRSPEEVLYPTRTAVPGEQVITDLNGADFIIEGYEDDGFTYTLRCYLGNRTNINLMFSWDAVTVNGCAIDPMWAMELPAGKQAYTEIIFFRSDLEENGIESVEDIEFRLTISDLEDWEAEPILDEVFTFRAEDFLVG